MNIKLLAIVLIAYYLRLKMISLQYGGLYFVSRIGYVRCDKKYESVSLHVCMKKLNVIVGCMLWY